MYIRFMMLREEPNTGVMSNQGYIAYYPKTTYMYMHGDRVNGFPTYIYIHVPGHRDDALPPRVTNCGPRVVFFSRIYILRHWLNKMMFSRGTQRVKGLTHAL